MVKLRAGDKGPLGGCPMGEVIEGVPEREWCRWWSGVGIDARRGVTCTARSILAGRGIGVSSVPSERVSTLNRKKG
jgi:hypothetical protein